MNARFGRKLVLVLALTASGYAFGDASLLPPSASAAAPMGTTAEQASSTGAPADAFGLGTQDYWLGASQFQPRSGANFNYGGLYYWYAATGAGTQQFEAQVNLPAGGLVTFLECFFNDSNASLNADIGFWKHSYDYNTDIPSVSNITTVSSSGSAGYQKPFTSPNVTIRYREGNLRNIYTLILNTPGATSTVSFRACRFFWNRQISPAPATASFTDVPVGSQFFAEVEALAAAGITAGCTATQYCPTATLTRLQMAAFLARAMGLHWPY
jgi:hypothetical protein